MDPAFGQCYRDGAVVWAGTPEQMTGEMQYEVRRRPDDGLAPSVSVVTEFADGGSAVIRSIGPPFEISHLVTRVADGTRLELVYRWPTRMEKSEG
jgi:hypothetical protein